MNPLDTLPGFENFQYRIVTAPTQPKLIAWAKAHECERRLAMYEWVERHNDLASPKHVVLLNDSLSATLMTFEACIQHTLDQYEAVHGDRTFETWFSGQTENDEIVKGIRTLRHLDAHVERYDSAGHVIVTVGVGPSSVARRWSLQRLTATDTARLRSSKLKTPADLTAWNNAVDQGSTIGLLTGGLQSLDSIMHKAEGLV